MLEVSVQETSLAPGRRRSSLATVVGVADLEVGFRLRRIIVVILPKVSMLLWMLRPAAIRWRLFAD